MIKVKKFWDQMNTNKSKDTAMAIVLILLLAGFFLHLPLLFVCAIPVLVVAMVCPLIFKPLAFLWFGFAFILGSVMSKFFLGLIFIVFVLPTGLVRRLLGKDPLALKCWKKSKESVFRTRTYIFTPDDIKNPF